MKDNAITRAFNFNIETREDEENKGILEGRAIVYDSEYENYYFTETISKGALDNTDLKDVRFLVNHDTSKIPLARSRNNNKNSTMQLIVDDQGLKVRIKLDVENNSDAKNLYSAVKRGDISGMSFMFTIRGEEWTDEDTEHPTRKITDIKEVFEVSAVTFPAYEQTDINARCKLELDNYKQALDNAKKQSLDNEKRDYIDLLKLKLKFKYDL